MQWWKIYNRMIMMMPMQTRNELDSWWIADVLDWIWLGCVGFDSILIYAILFDSIRFDPFEWVRMDSIAPNWLYIYLFIFLYIFLGLRIIARAKIAWTLAIFLIYPSSFVHLCYQYSTSGLAFHFAACLPASLAAFELRTHQASKPIGIEPRGFKWKKKD